MSLIKPVFIYQPSLPIYPGIIITKWKERLRIYNYKIKHLCSEDIERIYQDIANIANTYVNIWNSDTELEILLQKFAN
jgi:hypothetical protein